MEKTFEAEYELEKFKVIYDIDSLIDSVKNDKYSTEEDYEENGKSRPIGGDEDELNTLEEHNNNIDNFIKAIKDCDSEESLLNVISAFPKKKNGTFKRNQLIAVARLDNSYYSMDEYGWPCDELRFKPIDDNTLELSIKRTVIGY